MKILNHIQHFLSGIFEFISSNRYFKYFSFLVMALVTYRWFHFIDLYSVNVLFWDQWDFYAAFLFGQELSFIDIFAWQHSPHRQGLGFVLQILVDRLSGWNTRYVSFVLGILLFLTACIYLLIKKKLFRQIDFFDVIFFLAVLTPLQHEIFTGVVNLFHGAMPSLLISLFCLSLLIKNIVVRHLLLVIINLNLVFTGFGIFMGLLTPLLFFSEGYGFIKKGERKKTWITLFSFLVALFTLYLFTVGYTFNPANAEFQFPHPRPWEYLSFVALCFANYIGVKGTGFLPLIAGGAISVTVVFVMCKNVLVLCKSRFDMQRQDTVMHKIIVILIAFTLLFVLNSAVGRISFGLEIAQTSRYVPYLTPSILAIYFHLLISRKENNRIWMTAMMVILFISSFRINYEHSVMKHFSEGKKAWKYNYLKYEDIHMADSLSGFKIYPNPTATQLERKLKYLKDNNLNLFLDKK